MPRRLHSPPPSRGRGWGRGGGRRHRLGDLRQHTLDISQDFVIPETQHCETLRCEPGIADGIMPGFIVLPAVRLNDQACLEIHEVDDVHPERLLAFEFCTIEAMSAEVPPKQDFGVRHLLAEEFGELALVHG